MKVAERVFGVVNVAVLYPVSISLRVDTVMVLMVNAADVLTSLWF